MKLLKKLLCIILSTAFLGACNKNAPPVEDIKDREQTEDDNSTDMDDNNSSEVITDNESDTNPAVNDEDSNGFMEDEGDFEYTEDGLIPPEEAERLIKSSSDDIITALSNKDMGTLSSYIHPEKGVRFTLYSFVDKDKDIVFDKEGIMGFLQDQKTYIWGYFDGSGDAVEMTPQEYYNSFIYDKTFADADKIGYNTTLSGGNTLNNQFEVYENPIIVEYFFPGFDPQYEGLDWESLSLIFEEYAGTWYLVGIVSNRMTV